MTEPVTSVNILIVFGLVMVLAVVGFILKIAASE